MKAFIYKVEGCKYRSKKGFSYFRIGGSIAAISLASVALTACSTSSSAFATPQRQKDLLLHSVDSDIAKPMRVIVKFRQTVPYSDEAFLQDIAQHIHARIAYISSVSLDTHVYQVEPQTGQSQAEVLRSLATIPSVLRVEADAMARPS